MDWMKIIQKAIDEIEARIGEEIDADLLAESQFVSSFYFQKMFSVLCGCTVGEYIRNRRMTLAGYEISDTDNTVLDIGLRYGYESNESFTKAFTRFHGMTPSVARRSHANLNAFSRISLISNLTGGKIIMGSLGERGYI